MIYDVILRNGAYIELTSWTSEILPTGSEPLIPVSELKCFCCKLNRHAQTSLNLPALAFAVFFRYKYDVVRRSINLDVNFPI